MRIFKRLSISFGWVFFIILVLSALLFWSLYEADRQRERVENNVLELVELVKLDSEINQQLRELSEFMILSEMGVEVFKYLKAFEAYKNEILKTFQSWESLIKRSPPKIQAEKMKTYMELHRRYLMFLEDQDRIVKSAVSSRGVTNANIGTVFLANLQTAIARARSDVEHVTQSAMMFSLIIQILSWFIIGISFLFLAILSIRITRSISDPIERLKIGAEKLGMGRLGKKVFIDSKDEIGELAHTFNQMADDLQKSVVSKSYVDNIFQSMADILFVVDRGGIIQTVNQATQTILQYEEKELVGKPLEKLFLEAKKFEAVQLKQRFVETAIDNEEIAFRRKDGTEVPILFSSSIMRNEKGGVKGVICISRDITERNRLEQELLQAQKMEAIGRLAGGVAHDFNNLLTVIIGCTQMRMAQLPKDDPGQKDFQAIDQATSRAVMLTSQLLAFSRRQVVEPKVVDLNELITELSKMLSRLIGEDIKFVYTPGGDVGSIKVDPGQMQQILMNLAVNARDAMPHGGQFTVEATNVTLSESDADRHQMQIKSGNYVMLAISDNGIGMSREVQEKIFEPFYTTKEEGKGTGLGLATVYGIVKQAGGHIWVYSEVDHGTTFKIFFPRVTEKASSVKQRQKAAEPPKGEETVLLAEDDVMVRRLTADTLRHFGYNVLEASDGRDALRIIQEYKGPEIKLLLTDVVMPQMGGKELAEKFKATHPKTNVLFTSGYTDDTVVQYGLLDESIDFIQKPYSPDALLWKVREVIDKKPKVEQKKDASSSS